MGEITQNLLKLTEFPFSYSLLGLLALIFGQGIDLQNLSFKQIGPLLILIGFVATTLSICDPMGALQRRLIRGENLKEKTAIALLEHKIFGMKAYNIFKLKIAFLIAVLGSPDEFKSHIGPNAEGADWRQTLDWKESLDSARYWAEELDKGNIFWGTLLEGWKQQTLRTKWIGAEIDRITSLLYFMIIISLFFVATLASPGFVQKFTEILRNQTGVANEQIKNQTGVANEQTLAFAKIVISILSFAALIAVSYMFVVRIFGSEGLEKKARTVFRYLIAIEAIKMHKNFEDSLNRIERYLDENDWTLANSWVHRVQDGYSEFFLKEVTRV